LLVVTLPHYLVICCKNSYIFLFSELYGDCNTGINFDKYEDIPVEATGYDVPACINFVCFCVCLNSEQLSTELVIEYRLTFYAVSSTRTGILGTWLSVAFRLNLSFGVQMMA